MKAIAALIVRVAIDNPGWGYCRIQGELKDLGHAVASTTIAKVLKANGIKPAPDRPSSWRAFLKAQMVFFGEPSFRRAVAAYVVAVR